MNASDNRAFADVAARAQRLANERGGDYSALTIDELCAFMVEFDEALSTHGEPPRFYRAAADGAASDRDLAEAIYAEITSQQSVHDAFTNWNNCHVDSGDMHYRMWFVLSATAAAAIDAVLTRRLREAARTGPWEPRSEAHYERMQEALEQIAAWSEAYPLDIFPEPDLEKARQLLEAGGITLDAVSAHCMRHVIEAVGNIAREAARTGPWDET